VLRLNAHKIIDERFVLLAALQASSHAQQVRVVFICGVATSR